MRPATSADRCSTPKRCCSSTTATARSRSSNPSWISACVPTTTSAPNAASAFPLARRAREQRAAHAELETEVGDREEVLLGERLGRCHERALARALDGAQERVECDDRLPGADVALQEPLHRDGARQVAVELANRLLLVRRERERQRLAIAVDSSPGSPSAGASVRSRSAARRAMPTWRTSSSSKASRCRPVSASPRSRGRCTAASASRFSAIPSRSRSSAGSGSGTCSASGSAASTTRRTVAAAISSAAG